MSNTPTLFPTQLIFSDDAAVKALLRQKLFDLRVAAPAIVKEFDAVKQVVSVQIAMAELVQFPNGPEWTAINPIFNVPVVLPRAGGFTLTMPIAPGDEGLLVFTDTMFDMWWVNGGQQPPAGAPLTQTLHERRRHDLTDCFFIPGCWNQTRVLSSYSTDSAQLRSDDGTVTVDMDETGITLTGPNVTINSSGNVAINATGQVVISSGSDNTEIDSKVFLLHEHSGVQTGGSNTGAVVP